MLSFPHEFLRKRKGDECLWCFLWSWLSFSSCDSDIKTSVVRGIKDFHKNHVSSFFIMAMDLFLATELLKRKAKVLLLAVTVSFSIPNLWNPSLLIRGGMLPVSSNHGKTVKNNNSCFNKYTNWFVNSLYEKLLKINRYFYLIKTKSKNNLYH